MSFQADRYTMLNDQMESLVWGAVWGTQGYTAAGGDMAGA